MRELKFRAWDKIHDKYREPMVYDILNEKIVVRFPIETLKKGEFLLEQYTGLKDKNGEEIYEGDIVKSAYTRCNYIVVYRRYDASFVLENDDREEIIHLHYDRQSDYEVAGNIHENPELLEEE